jgi:hypothetical protein
VTLRSITGSPALATQQKLFLSPDGQHLLSHGSSGMMLWNLADGAPVWPAASSAKCASVAPAFHLGLVLCADPYGRVSAVDLGTGVGVGQRFDFQQGFVSQVVLSADGSTLTVSHVSHTPGSNQPSASRAQIGAARPTPNTPASPMSARACPDRPVRDVSRVTPNAGTVTFAIVEISNGVDASGACYALTICWDLRISNVRDISRSVSNTAVL